MNQTFESLHPRRPDGRFDVKTDATASGVSLSERPSRQDELVAAMALSHEQIAALPDAETRDDSIEATAGDIHIRIEMDDDGNEDTITYTYPETDNTRATVTVSRKLPVELAVAVTDGHGHRVVGTIDENEDYPVIDCNDENGWFYDCQSGRLTERTGRTILPETGGYRVSTAHSHAHVSQNELDGLVARTHPLHSANTAIRDVERRMADYDVARLSIEAHFRGLRQNDGAYAPYRS